MMIQMMPPGSRPHPPYHRWVDFLPGSKPDSPSRHDDGSVLKRVSLDATATWCGDEEDDDDYYDTDDVAHRAQPQDNPLDADDTMMMLDWTEDDADHMDTGALPGLMMMDDYQPHDDSNALLNEAFLGEAEVPSSPMRTECCWDHLDAPEDDANHVDDAASAHSLEVVRYSSSSSRGVARTHSSSSSSSSAASGSDAQLSLQELFEQRRAQLEASMERSRKSRKYLEKHIQQRASLASVLADIERSSRQIIVEVLSTSDTAAAVGGRSGDDDDSEAHAGGEHEDEDHRASEEDEECSMVTVEV
jgi:hypothetical protein